MKPIKLFLFLLFGASLSAALCSAQSIPSVKSKALDNSEVTLPATAGPSAGPSSVRQVLILVVGFSHKSGDLCNVWDKKISSEFHADSRVGYFILPLLQSAPSMVRPMILHGMRKDVPAEEQSHYLPLYSKEDEWKKLVNISAADDPYLIVATPDGHVVWQAHGVYSDDLYAELKKSVSGVLGK